MTVLKRASELSQAFLAAFQGGKMCEAFPTAGERIKLTSITYDDMEAKCETYRKDPSKENLDSLETEDK
eukprot:11533302-Prorocentrum_lima.AAC.1